MKEGGYWKSKLPSQCIADGTKKNLKRRPFGRLSYGIIITDLSKGYELIM